MTLHKICADGCAYSISEREVGAYSIVAPVRDGFGQVVASLAISGPQFRLSEERIEIYKKMVKNTAEIFPKDLVIGQNTMLPKKGAFCLLNWFIYEFAVAQYATQLDKKRN